MQAPPLTCPVCKSLWSLCPCLHCDREAQPVTCEVCVDRGILAGVHILLARFSKGKVCVDRGILAGVHILLARFSKGNRPPCQSS
jgi:hypothetical protein